MQHSASLARQVELLTKMCDDKCIKNTINILLFHRN